MEMETALSKVKLGSRKYQNNLLDKMAAIDCRYNIAMDKSKKSRQMIRLGTWHHFHYPNDLG
jgi:hypothetical protein